MEKELERKTFLENPPNTRKSFGNMHRIPEDDSLTGQKKKIRKKQIQKQMRKEQTKSGRLSFDDEENQMVKGPGMKPGRTIGRYAVSRSAVSKGVSDPEEEEQDVATETVQFARKRDRNSNKRSALMHSIGAACRCKGKPERISSG